ncbi:hypothetical protein HF086_013164 [Spodoptera exigua]|uniref:Endonuclease/exonuclease/phosphatase domain-containing protein n=1 Tax=Spodoptera exigua TaxID=7107 RepID=A0A922MBP1_SPOEX|nr:hypothetical protein HF086_013164 [Spodoptera exigua]
MHLIVLMAPSKYIKFGLLNAGSLGTKQDEFLIAMGNHSVDIMAINETWLRSGDLNVNLLNSNSSKTRQLMDFFGNFNLVQTVTAATHFVNDSSSLIDIICTDALTRNVEVNHISELGHHAFITCETVFRKPKCKPRIVRFRPLADILLDYFKKDLNAIPWSDIGDLDDVDAMVQIFNTYITQLFDLHAPMKRKTYYKRPTPWITDNIRLMFKLRDEARQRSRETRLPHHKQYYLDLKHEAAAVREKSAYFKKKYQRAK